MDESRRRVIVSGRVQGVGYRADCRARAAELGLIGSVRNRDDGTVEVVAQGPSEVVDRLVDWCRDGPRHARVANVDVSETEPTDDGDDFRILG